MKISTAALVGVTILILSMGYKIHDLGERLHTQAVAADSSVVDVQELRQLHVGMRDLLNAGIAGGVSVAGLDVVAGRETRIDLPGTAIVYLFGTHCPVSPSNVQVLNELWASGIPVVGVVPIEPPTSVEVFVRSHSPEFPVLVQASGSLLSLLPRGATPLTAVFGAQGLEHLWLGPIEGERYQALAELPRQPPS